jgi:hypothetical protein
MRLYWYIGPKQILERTTSRPIGASIRSSIDVIRWVKDSGQSPDSDGCIIATFVVDREGALLVADRHCEHVACAGREPIRSAGEITFLLSDNVVEVVAISNQSTGYCPEPESWPTVAAALSSAGLVPPESFTLTCVFRRCPRCSNINLVKDGIFECGLCATELPSEYNCQTTGL